MCVQRVDAQPCCQALHDPLIRAEGLGERLCLGPAVAGQQCRARPAVEHQRAQPVGVARGIRERDAAAVAGSVELDVADSELRPDGIEIGRSRPGAVRVAAVSDATRAPAPARIDEHDVAAIPQGIEQREQRGTVGGRRHAVVARADEHGVARLRGAAVRIDLEPDADGAGCRIGSDQRNGDRAAARAAGAGAQIGGRSSCVEYAGRGQRHDRHPRTRRGYQRSPHPAQLGSHRCSNEMCGAPVSSARRNARCRRTKPKRNCRSPELKKAFDPRISTDWMSSRSKP